METNDIAFRVQDTVIREEIKEGCHASVKNQERRILEIKDVLKTEKFFTFNFDLKRHLLLAALSCFYGLHESLLLFCG